MAKDHHIKGLNTPKMAKEAAKYRKMFGVDDAEQIDIMDILEFRLREFYPGFRLIIKRDSELKDHALADIPNNQILVRQSIYMGAYEGDCESRLILAHELGHYLLHKEKNSVMHKTIDGVYETIEGLNSDESTEDQADMFAAHFLVKPSIAFELKHDPFTLSKKTGVPLKEAKSMISAAKRSSLRTLTHTRAMTFAEKMRARGSDACLEHLPLFEQ